MPLELDREGVFKAMIVEWFVKQASSGSVAVSCRFEPRAMQNGEEWDDWTKYDPYTFVGDYWVIGKDGKVLELAVQQLSRSTGWDGKLESVRNGLPPQPVVQVTVKSEEYKGVTRFKGGWMNPENHVGGAGSLDPKEIKNLDSQYGSLLRASASSVKPSGGKPVEKGKKAPAPKAAKRDEAVAPVGTGEEEHGEVERTAGDPGNQDKTPF